MIRAGLSLTVRLHGHQMRQRTVVASDMKQFYSRPLELRRPFEDEEFAHFVWGPDLLGAGCGLRSRRPGGV